MPSLTRTSSDMILDPISGTKVSDQIGILSDSSGISIESFPRQNGESDDSGSFTRALAVISTMGGSLIIPQGKTYTGTFLINKSNVKIKGEGTLKGILQLYGVDTTGIDRFATGTGGISIEGITIDGETTRNGITCKWVYSVDISHVTFKNCIKSLNFEAIPQSQHCSRFKVVDNRFIDSNYCVYVDYDPNIVNNGGTYGVGDLTFNDNICENRPNSTFSVIYHLWAKGLDGLIFTGNTLFFGATGQEKSNIYLEIFNWVNIVGSNNFFVPLEHAVHAVNGSNLVIHDNNIAWTKKESIYVSQVTSGSINGNNITWQDDGGANILNRTGVYVENSPYFIGTINDNTMQFPNEYAIHIVSSSYITMQGNNARSKYSTSEPVFFDSLTGCTNITIGDNTFTGFGKKLSTTLSNKPSASNISFVGNNEGKAVTLQGVHAPAFKAYSGNQVSIDVSDSNLVILANTVATTITAITTEDLNNTFARLITFYSYNANTSISRTIPSVTIKGTTASVNIPAGESMVLMVYGGSIREVSRSFAVS